MTFEKYSSMMVAKALFSHKYIMLITILTDNHPTLRQKSSPVTNITPELKKLAQDMIETMNYGKRGVGLAAPQVGISKRMIVCKIAIVILVIKILSCNIV